MRGEACSSAQVCRQREVEHGGNEHLLLTAVVFCKANWSEVQVSREAPFT